MANLKDIKNRIQSVESTKKITRAMKMVAAAKVKRAENAVKASRPFTAELNTMFAKLLTSVGSLTDCNVKVKSAIDNYPCLLAERPINSVGILVLTSNKGLAGAYNANIIRKTVKIIENYSQSGINCKLFIVGQKGLSVLKKKCKDFNCEIAGEYLGVANNPTPSGANIITEDIAKYFVEGQIDKIEIVTTRFKNMMSYYTEDWVVLPVQKPESDDTIRKIDPLMEFEPNTETILQRVVPLYITNIIYQALLEAQASELASRMTAMSAATSNAEKMLHDLSIEYNKTRQTAITQELIEVVSGANAQNN